MSKTSEELPDPDTPANTVKRRFGIRTDSRGASVAAVAKQKARGKPRADGDPDGT